MVLDVIIDILLCSRMIIEVGEYCVVFVLVSTSDVFALSFTEFHNVLSAEVMCFTASLTWDAALFHAPISVCVILSRTDLLE